MTNPKITRSTITATGAGAVALDAPGSCDLFYSQFSGSAYDIQVDAGSAANVYACEYDTTNVSGTLNAMQGDRAAWDTVNYPTRHAFDIADSTFIYHNDPNNTPLGGSLGPGSFYIGDAGGVAVATGISGDAAVDSAGVLTITAKAVDASNIALTNGSIFIGGADGAAHEQAVSGDASINNAGVLSLTTVNADVGTYGDGTHLAQITVDAKGRITAIGTIVFSGGGHVIQDEGAPLTNRANLNFAGAGVTATDDSGNNATLVTIPGGAGIGGSTGATDNAILRADGVGGGTVQNSLATVDDAGTVNIPTGQKYEINNAQHTHVEADLILSDITTDDASTAAHGFLPKLPGSASKYLGGDGAFHDIPTTISCFLDNAASDIGGYKTLVTAIPVAGEANISASITGSATVVEEFALAANQFDFISTQILHVHFHAQKTAGVKGVNAFVRVYHRTAGGVETLIGTSANTGTITSKSEFDLDVSVSDTVFSNTDRFVVKFLGNPTGSGTDPTLAIYYQGDTAARIEIGAALIAAETGTGLVGKIQIGVDGRGSSPPLGILLDWVVPFGLTITSWEVLADISGSIQYDLWIDTYANFPPTVADTKTGTDKPKLVSQLTNTSSALTGWTVNWTAGDVVRVNIDSTSVLTRALLVLSYTRS